MKGKRIIEISIVILIFVIALLFLIFTKPSKKAEYVEIYCNNELKKTCSLNDNQTFTLVKTDEEYCIYEGEHTEKSNYNIVVIENGSVYVKDADCPATGSTKCVNQGKKQFRGESIICLEHNIIIKVFGEEGDVDFSSK